jgi:uncharacterized protein YbdZ (MbtH family)
MRDEEEDTRTYTVVVNHEEQYSIWIADRELPLGWKACGKSGPKQECLEWIESVWTDMRPLSLRKKMEEWKDRPPEPPAAPAAPRHPLGKNDLVQRLERPQPVEAGVRPERAFEHFKSQVDRGYVFMKFVETGTELRIRVTSNECDFTGCDWGKGVGVAKLVGDVILNYNRARYLGDLDLQSLRGTGRLEFIAETEPGEGLESPS